MSEPVLSSIIPVSMEISQKFGDLDSKKFRELLHSFVEVDEEETILKSRRSAEQQLIFFNNTCKFCGKFECVADTEEGAYICAGCGRDNGEIIDLSQEWRAVSCDDLRRQGDPSRVGMPVNEHFKKASLSNMISGFGYQGYRRLQRYSIMDYDERSLLKNFQFIEDSTEDFVPEVVKEHAKNLYATISENENKRGKKKQSNMAACVFFASEGRELATDKEKLSQQFLIPKKKFTKGCNFYREQLFEKEPEFYAKMKPVTAEDEIKRIGQAIGMSEMYKNIACYVSYMAQELGIVIKNTPISIAVGSIFLVSSVYQLEIDKKEISSKFDISDVTINKSLSLLTSFQHLLIPTKKLFDKYMEVKAQNVQP